MERVENEVVLICEGNNKEGACDMLSYDVKMGCLCEGHNTSCGLGCEALSHSRKITCAEVSNARAHASGLSVVFKKVARILRRDGKLVATVSLERPRILEEMPDCAPGCVRQAPHQAQSQPRAALCGKVRVNQHRLVLQLHPRFVLAQVLRVDHSSVE